MGKVRRLGLPRPPCTGMMQAKGVTKHMTIQRDWAAAKAAMLSVAEQYFGPIPRDRKVRCRFHEDRTPSLVIYDDGWHCYGCAEGGDAIDLVQRLESCTRAQAYDRVMDGGLALLPSLPPPPKKPPTWDYMPGAEGVPTHPVLGVPTTTYPYLRDGELVGYACRWDYTDGREKDIRPASSVRDKATGELKWEWVGMQEPRPLYRPEATRGKLVVVEGEKCAAHLRAMGIEACTWAGGANAVEKADWSMATAGTVYVWPDNNEAGHKAAARVAAILADRGVEVLMVPVADLPPGHDAADIPDKAAIIARIKSSLAADVPSKAPQAPPTADGSSAPRKGPQFPFKCLGHRDGRYYILEQEGQSVLEKTTATLSKAGMLELAPLEWWIENFPKGKDGWDHEAALNVIIRQAKARIYTDDAQRGIGVWLDGGRIVYHAGDHLIVDGQQCRLSEIQSQYAYTASPIAIQPGQPLTDDEGAAVLDVCSINSWEDAAHGHIVAGWVMCAFLAGVLRWRPSIWIQGAAGTGKSEIIAKYILGLLGRFGYNFMGDSTAAGVRQALRCDARPVIMDESEPNNPKQQNHMAGLLQLMRQATSDTDAITVRGTPSGRVQSFHIRSPFCFGSIQSALERGADIDRVTVVRLKSVKAGQIDKDTAKALYAEWLALINAWPKDISARMLGRAIAIAPIAKQVVEMMSTALLINGGARDQRDADQLGALLGGAWLMQYSRIPSEQEATEWVGTQSWSEVFERDEETDADKALAALLGLVIVGDGDRASVADRIEKIDRTTGETQAEQQRVLGWYGLRRLDQHRLFVAYTCDLRREAMKHTLYPDVAGLLKQLPSAERNRQAIIAGKNCKGVIITH